MKPTSSPEPSATGVELRQVWPGYDPHKAVIMLSNALATATIGLTLMEWRLLLLAISAVRQQDQALPLTAIDLQAYRDVYHPGTTRYSLKDELQDALDRLADRRVTILDGHPRTVPLVEPGGTAIVPASASETGRATLLIRLHPDLTSELTGLKDRYILEPLATFVPLKPHSIRLLLLLRARGAWQSIHSTLALEDLRRRFDVPMRAYPRWADFRRKVLENAATELRSRDLLDVKIHAVTRLGATHKVLFEVRVPTPPPVTYAEAPELWAERIAKELGFRGDLDPYIAELGVQKVCEIIATVHHLVNSEDQKIPNPGGYLRTSLENALLEKWGPAQTAPPKAATPQVDAPQRRPQAIADEIVFDLLAARDTYLEEHFHQLDQAEQEDLRAAARDTNETDKPLNEDDELERALRVLEAKNPPFPQALTSFKAFTTAKGLLSDADETTRSHAILNGHLLFTDIIQKRLWEYQ